MTNLAGPERKVLSKYAGKAFKIKAEKIPNAYLLLTYMVNCATIGVGYSCRRMDGKHFLGSVGQESLVKGSIESDAYPSASL
jgi:hypothetical protein